MPATYYIVGGDGKEYGPVSAGEIQSWIHDRRIDRATRVRGESEAAWRRLDEVPELMALVPPPFAAGRPTEGGAPTVVLPSEEELLARDYRLRVLDMLLQGWQLFTAQFGALFGAAAILTGSFLVLGFLGLVPFAGLLTTPVSLIVCGPLIGGLWHTFVRAWRGSRVQPGEVFDGFRRQFAPLLLVYLVSTLLCVFALLPGLAPAVAGFIYQMHEGEIRPLAFALMTAGLVLMLVTGLIFWTLWSFALELVMDRGMGFWAAMELSRKVVTRHLLKNMLLYLACVVLIALGYFLCLVGIFFAIPWVFAIYACAYEELFGPRPGPAAQAA